MTPDPLTAALTAATLAVAALIAVVAKRALAKNGNGSGSQRGGYPPAPPLQPSPAAPPRPVNPEDTGRFEIDPMARFCDRFDRLDAEIAKLNIRLDRREEAEQRLTLQIEALGTTVATLVERTNWLARALPAQKGNP